MHRVASRIAFTELAGPDVAAVHIDHVPTPDEDPTYDSMGNLETVPPYPGHPAGRIIVGGAGFQPGPKGPSPELITLLRSQGGQDPLSLDTSWLEAGLVDEFLADEQFVDTNRISAVKVDDNLRGGRCPAPASAGGDPRPGRPAGGHLGFGGPPGAPVPAHTGTTGYLPTTLANAPATLRTDPPDRWRVPRRWSSAATTWP